MSMDEQYADWELDIYIQEMIENGGLDPEDDVAIQETREQLAELLQGGSQSKW